MELKDGLTSTVSWPVQHMVRAVGSDDNMCNSEVVKWPLKLKL